MAPSTRKSKAVDKEAHPTPGGDGPHNEVLIVQLPEDIDPTNLSKLLNTDNVTSLTPDMVINMYRYILSQHHTLENALRQVATAQESLAIKDADVEQAYQDFEMAQVETTEKFKSLQSDIDVLKQQNTALEQSRNNLQAELDAFNSSQKQNSHDADELRVQLREREREKRGLAETLEKVLATETRLQSACYPQENGSHTYRGI
jgi:nucleoprotein TPR